MSRRISKSIVAASALGAAGLLDGKNATTFHSDIADLHARQPSCNVKNGDRIVVDGNLITSVKEAMATR